jgi:tRNA threonylcarbamoyladenosine biosynthesis protein TsaB
MLTLTIDTSGEQYGLALSRGSTVLRQTSGKAGRTLDTVLFSALAELFKAANATMADINAIVACTGPGSFVGTRIGLAAANTFALARGIPVLGVSVLQVLADVADLADLNDLADLTSQPGGAEVVAAVNCVRDEIIHQTFTVGATPEARGEPALLPAHEFAARAEGKTVILRPSTLGRASDHHAFPGVGSLISRDYPELLPAMARLGAAFIKRGELPAVGTPLPAPLYLQHQEASA